MNGVRRRGHPRPARASRGRGVADGVADGSGGVADGSGAVTWKYGTVSISTTRWSSVITGWGLKETT
ncbi:hypothetical protein [Streptosporangium sp. NPDC049078]|uniref:hypothetical protein n=1 Tax=Streptosporangium sp. NPDC049078 TaxID=3155767 RepID=UPI00341CF492